MNKIEKGSIMALVVQVVAIAIGAMIIWPLMDLFFAAVISHTEFAYSVEEHVVKPLIFGCIAGVVFWVVDRIAVSKKKK